MKDYIIQTYGKTAFYEYLKTFIEKHRAMGGIIEYDNELNMPIRAVYIFDPISVTWENLQLIKKLNETDNEKA